MAIYVTGDIHGPQNVEKLWDWKQGKRLGRSDYLVVAGDFGYPWDFSEFEDDEIALMERGPYTLLFVDGNHERYDYWEQRPVEEWHGGKVQRLRPHSPIRRLCRGQVFDLGGCKVFTMGGAATLNKDKFIPGIDWWPAEMPSAADYAQARGNLAAAGWSVDYVITHTCASRILPEAIAGGAGALGASAGASACASGRGASGRGAARQGAPRPVADELTDFFDELEDKLAYKHWYFGHFHEDRTCDEKHSLLFNDIVELGSPVVS